MKKSVDKYKSRCSIFMALLVWAYVIEAITWYIKSNTIDNIFQAVCIGMMLCLTLSNISKTKGIKVQPFFFYYIFLVAFALLPDLLYGETALGVRTMIMYCVPLPMYLYVYNYYRDKKSVDAVLLVIPVVYGILVSLHMILYEIGSLSGVPIEKSYEYIGKMDYVAVIILMFGIPMGNYARFGSIAGRELVRAWGYAIEPSKLAAFLLIPIFISYGIYKETGKKIYCIAAAVCLICFILTLSRAGYIAFLGAIIFKKILEKKKTKATNSNEITSSKDISKVIIFIPGFIVTAFLVLTLMVNLGKIFPELTFLYFGIVDEQTGRATLVREASVNSNLIIKSFMQRPWGWGFSNTLHTPDKAMQDTNLSNAFILWLIAGGIGGAVISLMLILTLIRKYAIPCLKSSSYIKNAVGMTFIGFTIHALSYGTWMTCDYLVVVSMMAVIYNKNVAWNRK